MRLLSVSLLKLIRRPASWRTSVVMAGLIALIYLAIGLSTRSLPDGAQRAAMEQTLAFPGAYASLASTLLTFIGLAGAAYAGAIAGSEWSWGAFRVAISRGESRVGYVMATFAAVAVLTAVAFAALYVIGVALVLVAGAVAGVGADGVESIGGVPALIVAGSWAVAMQAAIGFMAAFVSRSQVAGIAAIVALMLGEQFAAMLLPADLLGLAPLGAASRLIAEASHGAMADAAIAAGIIGVYLIAAVGLAGLRARRTEVA